MTLIELREMCAKICEDAVKDIFEFNDQKVIEATSNACQNLAKRIRTIQLPEDNSLKMIPMKSEEYPRRKYWYIDTPEFYCDIEINEGEVSIFFRDRKSEQEDFCSKNINLQLPEQEPANPTVNDSLTVAKAEQEQEPCFTMDRKTFEDFVFGDNDNESVIIRKPFFHGIKLYAAPPSLNSSNPTINNSLEVEVLEKQVAELKESLRWVVDFVSPDGSYDHKELQLARERAK